MFGVLIALIITVSSCLTIYACTSRVVRALEDYHKRKITQENVRVERMFVIGEDGKHVKSLEYDPYR